MGTVIVTLGMGAGLAGAHYCINLIILHSIGLSQSSCPFQTPFWFKKAPELKPVLDEFGNTIPDQVWIEFGPMQNHKCVDYFRVESAKTDKYLLRSPHHILTGTSLGPRLLWFPALFTSSVWLHTRCFTGQARFSRSGPRR